MTEKRFTHKKWYNERQLFDGDEPFAIVDVYNQADKICDKFNELAKENQQLKNDCSILVQSNQEYRKENEQLKQFQDRVFSWIDMHLQRLPTLIDKEFNSDNEFADPSLYSGALQILETMKKELKGDSE